MVSVRDYLGKDVTILTEHVNSTPVHITLRPTGWSFGMSDSLRTRIAKALYGQIQAPVPLFDSQPDEVKDAWLKDADAVIRELGLRRDDEYEIGSYTPSGRYRYVTEWEESDDGRG